MSRHLAVSLFLLLPLAVRAADPPPPPFVEVPGYTIPAPPADQAQIVFLEPINKIQGMFPAGIYVIDGDQRRLLNVTSWKSKSVANLPPGKHMLLSSHVGHLMEANVEAGKRYYVLLRFIYANGLQLRPIRPSGTSEYRMNGPHFPKWMKQTERFVQMTPEAETYFDTFKGAVDQALQKARENWQAKTPAEIAELTLNVEDAVPL
jgi:hypothetical protein